MVKCPKCGHVFEPAKLKCKRCGHEWHQRDPMNRPAVCPNPKCKSPYWDRERRRAAKNTRSSKGGKGAGVAT